MLIFNTLLTRASRKGTIINIKLGDCLHHHQHGIGKVTSIRKRSFGGPETATFVELHFERDNLMVTLRKDDLEESVRNLITAKEAKSLLQEMQTWEGKVSKQWKTRANAHQAAIDRGDPFEYAKVFKGLIRLEARDTLRAQDRAHLNQSADLLTEEIAFSLKKTPEQARRMLNRASEI
jgi:RNA polymerase-interacting CarD/CdnL/TRCF family regulator